MITLDSSHPDIEEFIDLKSDLSKATKANISVLADDAFMEAALNETDNSYETYFFDIPECPKYTVNAKELLHKIAQRNWEMAEPGMLFYDNINKNHLLSEYKDVEIKGTNPCGEIPMMAGDACLLGSMNLSEYVDDKGAFIYSYFKTDIRKCVIALNEVQEESIELLPLEEQRKMAIEWKRIGLGFMGLADALIKMGIKYGSEESLNFVEDIVETMAQCAILASEELGREKGDFKYYDYDDVNNSAFYRRHFIEHKCTDLRNSGLLTVAPTGLI